METSTLSLEHLQSEIYSLRNENSFLKEQLEWFRRQIFGKRSEKVVDDGGQQLYLEGFENLGSEEQKETINVPAHRRVKQGRNGKDKITLPDNIPVQRCILDLPEDQKVCPTTGEALVKIGEEVTHKIAHTPGSYYVKELVRPKYACRAHSEEGVFIADLPDSIFPRCQADESLLASVIVKKFADHLPLFRQSEILAREGILISRQILCKWVMRCGYALKALYEEMIARVLSSNNVFVDESPVDMLVPGKGKVHQAFMWVIVGGQEKNPPYRVYHFRTDRCHKHAVEILAGYKGVVHSDKYGAYEALANKKQFTWCPCWSHIRRKFFDAVGGDKKFVSWVLRKIKYLFMLERVAWERSPEERLRIRQEKEAPIIDELTARIKDRLVNGKALPKSNLREALGYYCSLIPHLKNYTQHAFARLDNNVAERAIRPLAIGRKNWMFIGSEEGGEASAVLLSLVQTCRAIGVNPHEYLEDVMRRLPAHNSQKLHELLPDAWAAARRQAKASSTSSAPTAE